MESKKVKHLKVEWLKNAGSMRHIIDAKKEDSKVIHLHSKKHGRMWAEVSTDELLALTKKDNFIYEVFN
jgi:hypothetical protein